MIYTYQRYREEMAVALGAVEHWTNDRAVRINRQFPDPVQAIAITDARREVLELCESLDPDWIIRQDTITWPDADFIDLGADQTVLPFLPQFIALIELVAADGSRSTVYAAPGKSRSSYAGSESVRSVATPYRCVALGTRIEMYPRPTDRSVVFSYAPMPNIVTAADLVLPGGYDLLIPPMVQFAVPIRAARNLCVGRQQAHDQLTEKWIECEGRIRAIERRRNAASPKYPLLTNPTYRYRDWP